MLHNISQLTRLVNMDLTTLLLVIYSELLSINSFLVYS